MTLFKGMPPGGLTEGDLRRYRGLGPLFNFLRYQSRNCVRVFDDFTGDTLNGDNFVVTAGATATTYAHSAQANGMIRGACGTTAATSGLLLASPLMWYGDQDCGCEVRMKISDLDEVRVEIGFVDTNMQSVNTPQVNNLSTPTFNNSIADAALWLYDDSSTTRTSGLYTIGTAIDAAKTAGSVAAPVADTYFTVGIQISQNYVQCYQGTGLGPMSLVADRGRTASIEGGTALRFVICVELDDTNDTNVDIDYIDVWQQRLA